MRALRHACRCSKVAQEGIVGRLGSYWLCCVITLGVSFFVGEVG